MSENEKKQGANYDANKTPGATLKETDPKAQHKDIKEQPRTPNEKVPAIGDEKNANGATRSGTSEQDRKRNEMKPGQKNEHEPEKNPGKITGSNPTANQRNDSKR